MFKRLLVAVFAVFIGTTMVAMDAWAKRMGGGRSMGIQRSITPPTRQATPPAVAPQPQQARPNPAAAPAGAAAAAQQSGWRRWAAPLAGLAAGIGLAAMLSHFGLGGEFAGLLLALLLIALVVFVARRFFRSAQPTPAAANNAPYGERNMAREAWRQEPTGNAAAPLAAGSAGEGTDTVPQYPAGFDAEAFARQAKVNFIRLQAANDAGNLDDIRSFTSPEMFAEIKLDIDARGGASQRTDVVQLDAQVLEVAEENGRYIASVRYSGLLREEEGTAPQAFDEVWHLTKPVAGGAGWMVSGIQQVA